MTCPCGSNSSYEECCSLYHQGLTSAPTAEALMRSRYCAFAKHDIAYLKATTWPPYQKRFDDAGYLHRAQNSTWLSLEILETIEGGEDDVKGHVTFTAKSMVNLQIDEHKEKSLFKKKSGKWYYVKPVEA